MFDGISCAQVALNRIGIKDYTYYASEVDKYAIKVTQHNYPNTIQLGDVLNISHIDNIDLLIGGSPCQGFSDSGLGLNFNDPRSKLFFEYVRILNNIKPKYFLLENVRMKKEWSDTITDILQTNPVMIDSALVSGQSRKRLYWTNIPLTELPEDKNIKLQDVLESGFTDRDKSYCIDASYYKGGSLKMYLEKQRRQIVFNQSERRLMVNENNIIRMLTPLGCERLQTLPDNYTNVGISKKQRYKAIGNGFIVDVICHILKGLTK